MSRREFLQTSNGVHEIDWLVYELYRLTPEEIKVVEEGSNPGST